MGQLNISHDSEVTLKLLQMAPAGTILKLATGYFNLTYDYSQAILKNNQATCHFLTAHPTANGFFSTLLYISYHDLIPKLWMLNFYINFTC